MIEYKVKYKISSWFLVILIVFVVGATVFVNLYYLKSSTSQLTSIPDIKITNEEMEALNQIKRTVVDNPVYKQLVPVAETDMVLPEPSVKANPFQTIDQKESQE